jgi:hypothetical protein
MCVITHSCYRSFGAHMWAFLNDIVSFGKYTNKVIYLKLFEHIPHIRCYVYFRLNAQIRTFIKKLILIHRSKIMHPGHVCTHICTHIHTHTHTRTHTNTHTHTHTNALGACVRLQLAVSHHVRLCTHTDIFT